ncbi:Small glutamine-rich tetratricopeptide repeat-containing protein 2 [Microbotryomycetes sp. JL201]|nr:Small glutamine-rich tetratricopeptide repeat-containing protein 2 [Microbotryomycetes sp. JL201]
MSAHSQKRVAFQLLQFLKQSIDDGSIKSDDVEGIEVASQCISEAFGVDIESAADQQAFKLDQSLTTVLDKYAQQQQESSASTAQPAKAPATPEQKAQAEKAKARGNQLMASKDYEGAIKAYAEAIEADDKNPVYWSNRAAAHSQLQNHSSAISDARQALTIDPNFSKAYSRLGHALFSSGEYQEAVEAYEKGLELDPSNATMKSSLATAKGRIPAPASTTSDESSSSPVSSRGAPGAGAGAGAGGFPGLPGGMDLASLMNNPAIMQMAQQMMANGGLEQLMNNPMLRNMMNGAGGGGGMPSLEQMMADPEMRRMAEQFGRSMGGGAGRGGGNNNNGDNMFS